jgi:hypothetical protein
MTQLDNLTEHTTQVFDLQFFDVFQDVMEQLMMAMRLSRVVGITVIVRMTVLVLDHISQVGGYQCLQVNPLVVIR